MYVKGVELSLLEWHLSRISESPFFPSRDIRQMLFLWYSYHAIGEHIYMEFIILHTGFQGKTSPCSTLFWPPFYVKLALPSPLKVSPHWICHQQNATQVYLGSFFTPSGIWFVAVVNDWRDRVNKLNNFLRVFLSIYFVQFFSNALTTYILIVSFFHLKEAFSDQLLFPLCNLIQTKW